MGKGPGGSFLSQKKDPDIVDQHNDGDGRGDEDCGFAQRQEMC